MCQEAFAELVEDIRFGIFLELKGGKDAVVKDLVEYMAPRDHDKTANLNEQLPTAPQGDEVDELIDQGAFEVQIIHQGLTVTREVREVSKSHKSLKRCLEALSR